MQGARFAVLALVLAGCSGGTKAPEVVAAEGIATLNGQPLPNAQISFTPTAAGVGGQFVATGVTDEQGKYKLTCNGKPGAAVGENIVTVAEGPLPDELRDENAQAKAGTFAAKLKNRPIPTEYGVAATSKLKVTVAAGKTDYPLELKR